MMVWSHHSTYWSHVHALEEHLSSLQFIVLEGHTAKYSQKVRSTTPHFATGLRLHMCALERSTAHSSHTRVALPLLV